MIPSDEIIGFLDGQPEPKRSELHDLHHFMLAAFPRCRLWFSDGRNADGKIVANPTVGYGEYTIVYADGSSKDFYRIGISANKTGISVYVLGLPDKAILSATFGDKLGKASVTGYCIKFKRITDINVDTLHEAIRYGMTISDES